MRQDEFEILMRQMTDLGTSLNEARIVANRRLTAIEKKYGEIVSLIYEMRAQDDIGCLYEV